jgi:CHAT domain-containing protein
MNNLAIVNEGLGRYAKAVELQRRVLALKERVAGPDHPEVAITLNNLAKVYYDQGEYGQARQSYQRARAILEKKPGVMELDFADSLTGLGAVSQIEGDYAQAEDDELRALAIRQRLLGPDHPRVAQSLGNLSWLYRAKEDPAKAVSFLARCNEIIEHNLGHNLAAGSERRKLAYLEMFAHHSDRAISLHVQSSPDNPEAIRLAVTSLLRRKGRALDAMTDTVARVRRHATADDQTLLDQLTATRAQLATLTLGAPGSPDYASVRSKEKRLEERLEQLESEISARSDEFKIRTQPITLDGVQARIPAGAALVEFAQYLPVDAAARKFRAPRYIAYVISPSGLPRWAELGEAAVVDAAVEKFRRALRAPTGVGFNSASREVDKIVMRPVRAALGGARRVFISPYGSLNLLPFAALIDERGRYLVERYSFNYLTSGRDLLRSTTTGSRSGPIIIAAPAFGERPGAAEGRTRGLGLKPVPEQAPAAFSDLARVTFEPIPGAASEALTIGRILPQARTLMGEQATETALKQISGPSVLHIATHGFFLKDVTAGTDAGRGFGLSLSDAATTSRSVYDPLLRSGLALAGANERHGGDDDGILTALEAASLDLAGTKLVVLSACNTGVGEIKRGEGVYGLRRALALAGAETQVISLWPVSDLGTRDLMVDYYRALIRGEGRSEALRQAQLRMLRGKTRRHPYYWASFIQSGEWKSLEGKEPGAN